MRIFLAVIALALVTSCTHAPAGRVSLPAIPAMSAAGLATFSGQQVTAECSRLAPFAAVDLSDSKFTEVDHEWLVAAVDWAWNFGLAAGIVYTPESFDCDKFAKAFSLAAEIATARAGVKAQPLVARIYVYQGAAFGGVAAGGAHALNAFRSNRGYYVLEPQAGGVKRLVPLAEYPNRNAINRIKLGG